MKWEIRQGDAAASLRGIADNSIHCCITSPPYWGLRDYGVAGQIGLEPSPDLYVSSLVAILSEVRRVLRPDGTLWLNLGDSYATGAGKVGECPGGGVQGSAWKARGPLTAPNRMPLSGLKPKDLVGIPWRVAFALQADGWYLRSDIIWHKPNAMPESIIDRPTKAHEYIFLLSKKKKYFYSREGAIEPCVSPEYDKRRMREGRPRKAGKWFGQDDPRFSASRRAKLGVCNKVGNGETRNRRTVWTITTTPFKGAHFATFPQKLVEPCILAGSPRGGIVLDPFSGSGTVGVVALLHQRQFIGIELNPKYCAIARERIMQTIDTETKCDRKTEAIGLKEQAI